MKQTIEGIADRIFRGYFVPLYPDDKPISEMTSYERGMYKQTLMIVSQAEKSIIELILAELPEVKNCYCNMLGWRMCSHCIENSLLTEVRQRLNKSLDKPSELG